MDIIKDIYTVDSMKNAGYSNEYSGDYSERYMRPMYAYDNSYGSSYNSYDNRGRGMHAERDSQGRYSGERGYSRDSESELQAMMNRAKDEREREVLRKALEDMRR